MKPGTVLVVDDDTNVRKAVRRVLSPRIATVLLAEDADAAEQLMSQHPVDVAIIDEKMPGRTGLEFLSVVREKHPDTRCILLTGWAPYHKMVAALRDGRICTFLRKPWEDAELIARVEKLMDAAKAQDVINLRSMNTDGNDR